MLPKRRASRKTLGQQSWMFSCVLWTPDVGLAPILFIMSG
jgi:hypothetical protein